MIAPILATKLYIPPVSPSVVPRPRLVERLNQGLDRKLTLISAPAGFGKTTLVSEWAGCCGRNEAEGPPGPSARQGSPATAPARTAWLSLDEEDNDLARFLAYLVAALRMAAPGLGEGALGLLQSSLPPPAEPILVALLNDIITLSYKIILVLDDYHVIDSKPIDEALAYLVEHLPSQLHVAITTREDPELPLPRLRGRNQMTELRAADLRFTPAETAGFLAGMGINPSPSDVAALDDRTEGWIAGLQLAALAMQSFTEQGSSAAPGGQDLPASISGFIRAFAGDHRHIMDYLVEEVLQRQPEPGRSFLLQTSILERLHGPLCEAVTLQAGGSAQLQALERANFFVVPLDDQRRWYRYHRLFAEVLRAYLKKEQPDQVAVLHRRASAWFEQHGAAADAIRHALAADDCAHAADLIELVYPAMSRNRQEAILLAWLKTLPETLVRDRPLLCNLYAGALMQTGEIQGVHTWLRAAERWLPSPDGHTRHDAAQYGAARPKAPASAMVVVNHEEFSRLPGAVAMHRAGLALLLGDVADTVRYARQALALAPEDDHLRRGGAAVLQGLALWTNGDLEAAEHMYGEGMASLRRAGYISDVIGSALALADIRRAQGRLREALRVYEGALQMAAEQGTPTLRGTADMLVGMSELYLEQNDLPAARQCLLRSQEQGEHTGLPQNRYRWRAAMALLRETEGDLDGALALLDEAERLYMSDFSPNVRPVAAMRVRVWAAQGRLEHAFDWARARRLSVDDQPSYLREFEHITLVRILLACYRRDREDHAIQAAGALLDRLLTAAQAGGRTRSVIEIRILQTLALEAQGTFKAALVPLQKALALAEPEGYVRMFVAEGPPMEQLLREAALCSYQPDYTRKLLAAFSAAVHQYGGGDETPDPTASGLSAPVGSKAQPEATALVEPLSQRELEVLRLFPTELSGPEIAQELMVALSTVRTHTKSIYGKLNVNNRRAAVRRANELKLI